MITTSDAVQVAAASSNSSTGEVATVELPSTRIAGLAAPPPLPSNSRSRSQRIVTSAVRATSVPPPRRETDVEPVPAHPVHAVVLEQPIERGPVPQLEAEHHVEPEIGALRVGAAVL